MDPLEERLRRVLREDQWRLPTDPQLLARVRAGAARRRRRRSIAVVAAAVSVVAVGSGVVGHVVQGSERASVAGSAGEPTTMMERSTAENDTLTTAHPGETGPSEVPEHGPVPPLPGPTGTDESGPAPVPTAVAVPDGFTPVSVAAVSTGTLWVLGTEDAPVDGTPVAVTKDGGTSFAVAGRIRAPAAHDPSEVGPDTVRHLTFAPDGRHGWAYGGAVWSTRDAGRSWSRTHAVPGTVERLETDGSAAYALVRGTDAWRLWRTTVGTADWRMLAVELRDPSTLTVTNRLVALTDRDDGGSYVLVSTDSGASFARHDTPCAPHDAGQVAAAGASLWLTCATGTERTVHLSTDQGATWARVPTGPLPGTASELGVRNAREAVAALPGRAMLLGPDGVTEATVEGLGEPTSADFSTEQVGYLLDAEGNLFRTTDGGATWRRIEVA